MNRNRRGKYEKKIIYVCVGDILIYEIIIKISLFQLNADEISRIEILLEYTGDNKSYRGTAKITGKQGIKEAVQKLNTIKAYRGGYFVESLEGEFPPTYITIYYLSGKKDNIIFYYDVATDGSGYYRIKLSEHDKIAELCKKYGECLMHKY